MNGLRIDCGFTQRGRTLAPRYALALAVALLLSAASTWLAASTAASPLQLALNTVGDGSVILFRHAIAPGGGDPAGFRPGDCSTQRNLDPQGREQARRMGEQLRRAGVPVTVVWTSQWCRTQETAALAFPLNIQLLLGEAPAKPENINLLAGSSFASRRRGPYWITEMLSACPRVVRMPV